MTTATKKRKTTPRGKKAMPRKEVARRKSAGQSDKFAANQPPITGLEDVDERIESLDEECQLYLSEADKKKAAKQSADEALQKIGELLKEHGLDLYKLNGQKFYIEPGTPTVKVVKLNQKG